MAPYSRTQISLAMINNRHYPVDPYFYRPLISSLTSMLITAKLNVVIKGVA